MRRGRRWALPVAVGVLILAAVGAAVIASVGNAGRRHRRAALATTQRPPHKPKPKSAIPDGISFKGSPKVHIRLRPRAAGGLLVDLDTGHVLWSHAPFAVRPIASLTKVMTALLVVEHLGKRANAKIGADALHYTGSEVGVLPLGKKVPVTALLYGLMLPSGNDAAVALADRVAGSDQQFATLMNKRAKQLGLRCSHFSSSYGLQNDNQSCPVDLAALSRVVMRKPRIEKIVAAVHVNLPFPIRGGRLDLWSHNPLIRLRYPGTIGLKTGFTDAAGRCFIGVARHGNRTLAAILLNSPDIGGQARQLLDAGFHALGV
ncbi:MAG: D-alanyl-D-alanine carboxypeptidase [Actinobacteria bacterium]|nr:D-alanyl-D-alanine carboxypeptidase [Actinomycetota bacterium]